jgi:hypothetical protein
MRDELLLATGICLLSAGLAEAQTASCGQLNTGGTYWQTNRYGYPCVDASGSALGNVTTTPTSSAPTSFSGTLTTAAAQYLAAGTYKRIGFQVFGTGTACYSFTSASVSISGTSCTNGYSITPSSGGFVSSPVAVPNTALYIVEASGSTLTVYGDWQ